jgi:DNA-binding NarL/FixJ family response regulator
VRETLADAGAAQVVAEAASGEEALELARGMRGELDVAVVDLTMPDLDGLEVVSRLTREQPGLAVLVLVLTMHPTRAVGLQVLEAGARGFLSKSDAPQLVCDAVARLAGGGHFVTPELSDLLAERALAGGAQAALSARELEVVRALASGLSCAEAAGRLGLSASTVSSYKARAKAKLALGSDAALARYAAENGLVE